MIQVGTLLQFYGGTPDGDCTGLVLKIGWDGAPTILWSDTTTPQLHEPDGCKQALFDGTWEILNQCD